MTLAAERAEGEDQRSSIWAILLIFTRLGLTSFGGPIAHLGYFREEFVARRRWMSEAGYADLVALAQFMPGPASSQVGYAVGVLREGFLGGLAAWAGFTLPSVFLLIAFAYGAAGINDPIAASVLHGLKIVAVAVVAQAVWGMARCALPRRCPRHDRRSRCFDDRVRWWLGGTNLRNRAWWPDRSFDCKLASGNDNWRGWNSVL